MSPDGKSLVEPDASLLGEAVALGLAPERFWDQLWDCFWGGRGLGGKRMVLVTVWDLFWGLPLGVGFEWVWGVGLGVGVAGFWGRVAGWFVVGSWVELVLGSGWPGNGLLFRRGYAVGSAVGTGGWGVLAWVQGLVPAWGSGVDSGWGGWVGFSFDRPISTAAAW